VRRKSLLGTMTGPWQALLSKEEEVGGEEGQGEEGGWGAYVWAWGEREPRELWEGEEEVEEEEW